MTRTSASYSDLVSNWPSVSLETPCHVICAQSRMRHCGRDTADVGSGLQECPALGQMGRSGTELHIVAPRGDHRLAVGGPGKVETQRWPLTWPAVDMGGWRRWSMGSLEWGTSELSLKG